MKRIFLVVVSVFLVLSILTGSYSEENQQDISIDFSYDDTYSEHKEQYDELKFPLDYVAYNYDHIMSQIDMVEDKEACLKAVMTVLYVMNSLQFYGSDDITLQDIYACLNTISVDCDYFDVDYEVLTISDYITMYSTDPFLNNSLRVRGNEGFVIYFEFVFDTFTTIRIDIPFC